MKIGPLELRRARAAAATPTTAPHKPAGASGTINMAGFLVPDEYNDDLRWPDSLKIYRRMLRGDAAVREAYMHTVAPVLNATWDIDPASDDPQDLEIAEFIRRAYFEWPVSPFKQTLALTLHYLAQGFQLFELTEQIVDAEIVYQDPKTNSDVTVPTRQFVTWRRWEHRRPETIWKWNSVDGELQDVIQLAYKDGTYGEWEIPVADIALFVNEQEGDDFTGVSLLRSAYKSWYEKDLIEKIMTMSVERHGLGVTVGYLPDEARNDEEMIARFDSMFASLKAGQSSHLIFPGPKQQASTVAGGAATGYLVEVLTPGGGLPDFVPILNYLRGDIKGAVLARFSELGHSGGGSSGKSGGNTNTQAEIWYAALHATADYVASVHNEKIKQLVLRNYTDIERFPTLVPRDIETKSLSTFAAANAALVAAGAIEPDKSYRAYIRAGIDAPDEDETSDVEDPADHTEPEGGGAVDPQEAQKRLDQQDQDQQMADNAAAIGKIVAELQAAADDVVSARRKDERSGIADSVRAAAELLAALPKAPDVHVALGDSIHGHRHEHRHDGLNADQVRDLLDAQKAAIEKDMQRLLAEQQPAKAARQWVDRDADGRLTAVREYDDAGALIRYRRVTAHNDDGTVKTIIDEPTQEA